MTSWIALGFSKTFLPLQSDMAHNKKQQPIISHRMTQGYQLHSALISLIFVAPKLICFSTHRIFLRLFKRSGCTTVAHFGFHEKLFRRNFFRFQCVILQLYISTTAQLAHLGLMKSHTQPTNRLEYDTQKTEATKIQPCHKRGMIMLMIWKGR